MFICSQLSCNFLQWIRLQNQRVFQCRTGIVDIPVLDDCYSFRESPENSCFLGGYVTLMKSMTLFFNNVPFGTVHGTYIRLDWSSQIWYCMTVKFVWYPFLDYTGLLRIYSILLKPAKHLGNISSIQVLRKFQEPQRLLLTSPKTIGIVGNLQTKKKRFKIEHLQDDTRTGP